MDFSWFDLLTRSVYPTNSVQVLETSAGSTAENLLLHKLRHRICSVGLPIQADFGGNDWKSNLDVRICRLEVQFIFPLLVASRDTCSCFYPFR